MNNQFIYIVVITTCSWLSSYGQYTQVPDNVFEQHLIDQGIDTEGILDGQVLTDDIANVITLNVSPESQEFPLIQDLTGIEDFTDLEFFVFSSNAVEEVDLSQNFNLKTLVCNENNLQNLDVSGNVLLETLNASNCPIGVCEQENTFSVLNLSNNTNLKSLVIGFNNYLQVIDLSNNPMLEGGVFVENPELTTLNVKNGNNENLQNLNVLDNINLTCITVDDPLAATQGDTYPYDQWNIQEGIVFSEDCSLGIEEAISVMFTIFPNPTKDLLTIQNQIDFDIDGVVLYDTLGRKVMEYSEATESIDVSNLTAGIYFIHITTDRGIVTKKVIKE
jgi:hypothetical protein